MMMFGRFFHLFTTFASITIIIGCMNKILSYPLIALTLVALSASCSDKKPSNVIITKKQPIIVKSSKPKKMGDYAQTRSVEWIGNKYTIVSKLTADTSLPLASDGPYKYYDNSISIRIVRANGTEFFSRTFQKSDFKNYVDDYYYSSGALLGIVFVKAEGNNLVFAASVGNPDKSSDEYMPMILKVNNFGAVSITKDSQLDTATDTQAEEDGV